MPFMGASPLSNRIALNWNRNRMVWVCTLPHVGHSLSFGRADADYCFPSAILADAVPRLRQIVSRRQRICNRLWILPPDSRRYRVLVIKDDEIAA